MALSNSDSNPVGTLRLNSSDRNERSPDSWHLIKLSLGSVELSRSGKDLLDHHFADVSDKWILPSWKTNNQHLYEFYNVMHVKWTATGVASRLIVGRVEKDAWERLPLEEVEV